MYIEPPTLNRQYWRRWRGEGAAPAALEARRVYGRGYGFGLRALCPHCLDWHTWHPISRAEWEGAGAVVFCKNSLKPVRVVATVDGATARNWRQRQAAQERRRARLAQLRAEVRAERAALGMK